ncbi:outer membrane protein assembly factor BamB family protein [Flavobacterium tibetense]|uniref:Pyrrolo-quinoline quinone repeat domain-containing protein n=1 Tax=Flavobacterium tibetense TaxID=2233533 RepID=A0A365P4E8_9FLAO|nr:PQQ-binding-like beta-propeller repeat protein [Flavobacterium tibetense]RBA29429.1 hypothetical protein DPN68_01935 [Flavobacterium tibetense]
MRRKLDILKWVAGVLILLNCYNCLAQNPDFTYKLGGKITFMKLTDAGVLVVANGEGLVGIKPGASQPHFNFTSYGKVKPEEMDFIPMSPYLVVSQGGFMTAKKSVIDFVSGKKMFGTEDNGWKFTNRCDVMLPQNKLVVLGSRKSGAMAIGLYDLATGKEESLIELNDPKKVGSVASIPQFSGRPTIIGNGLLVPTTKNLIQINTQTGKIDWTTKTDDITWVVADESGTEIYCFEERPNGDTKIFKVSNKGEILWKEGQKLKGRVVNFQILPQGLAVVSNVDNSGKSGIAKIASSASESKIMMLSAKDGEDLWEKAPKTKGYVQHFYVMEDGILFGIQEGGINKISFGGTPLFKKPLKTGENIHTMAMTPKGMIYITDSDANIIDLKTGESIWNKPIQYKKAKAVSSTYDKKNKRYLISTGEEMIAIDENSGDVSTLASYKFNEKEVPGSLTSRDGGLLLTSSQNIMMLNFDGSQKFHEYYKSPGKSTAGKIFAGVMGVASVAVASSAALTAGANKNSLGDYNSYGERAKIVQDGFSDIASASFTEMSKRFKATSATENYQYILTMLDSGVGLVKINKDNGSKEKEVLLKDKKPEYEVDEIGGMLYYQKDGSTIYAFDLQK